jgi:hypothetical protein
MFVVATCLSQEGDNGRVSFCTKSPSRLSFVVLAEFHNGNIALATQSMRRDRKSIGHSNMLQNFVGTPRLEKIPHNSRQRNLSEKW